MHLCTYFTVYSITISNGQHNLSFRQKGTIASQVMRYHADWLCVRSPNKQQEAHPCTRTSPKSLLPWQALAMAWWWLTPWVSAPK